MNTSGKTKNIISPEKGAWLFFIIIFYVLIFEDLISAAGIPAAGICRNILPVLAVICFFLQVINGQERFRSLLSPFALCGIFFVIAGIAGWIINHWQPLRVTLHGMYEHLRFWLCLYLFLWLCARIPLEKYARRLFLHVAALSAFFFTATCLDIHFHIWGRQMFRYGTSSIQLFYSHPSKLGARAVFLLALLCILRPYMKGFRKAKHAAVLNTVLTFALLGVIIMTLRVRLFGFVIVFLILYFWMIVFRKRLHLPAVLAGAAGALLIGGKRLFDFYFSPYAYTMARGQLAVNSVDIANTNIPFGGGFGTFGSRTAQIWYSPLYYKYYMMTTTGLTPEYPYFACDTFFPAILGETGWLGLAAFIGLIVCLAVMIFRGQKQAVASANTRYALFAAVCLLVYELLEATGTLSFSEYYSVMIALGLALAIRQLRRSA